MNITEYKMNDIFPCPRSAINCEDSTEAIIYAKCLNNAY